MVCGSQPPLPVWYRGLDYSRKQSVKATDPHVHLTCEKKLILEGASHKTVITTSILNTPH